MIILKQIDKLRIFFETFLSRVEIDLSISSLIFHNFMFSFININNRTNADFILIDKNVSIEIENAYCWYIIKISSFKLYFDFELKSSKLCWINNKFWFSLLYEFTFFDFFSSFTKISLNKFWFSFLKTIS